MQPRSPSGLILASKGVVAGEGRTGSCTRDWRRRSRTLRGRRWVTLPAEKDMLWSSGICTVLS